MVVKMKNRKQEPPTSDEETGYDLATYLRYVLGDNPFPDLDESDVTEQEIEVGSEEDAKVTQTVEHQTPRSESQKVAVWTMAAVIGAVTTYGIAVGDRQLLMTILMVAALLMVRLFGRTNRQARGGKTHGKENNDGGRGSG